MFIIKALNDTFLKKEPIDSSKLVSTKKKLIIKDEILNVDKAVKVEDHYLCTLAFGSGDWYVFSKHWSGFQEESKTLVEEDYIRAAKNLNCEVAVIKAVVEVESSGSGFLSNGKPKILFEAHHFSKHTNHKFDYSYPLLSSRVWNRRLYKGGLAEWTRLEAAIKLDRKAAIQSASFGLMQILGSNFKACGYSSPEDYYRDQFISEGKHLDCFINFVQANKLDIHLRNKDWSKFARGYNGPSFAKNSYHIKLQTAYNKFNYDD